MLAENETFVFGSELLGRRNPTPIDKLVGGAIFTLALAAVTLGSYNLYLIKIMPIFHCAFGRFLASRTVGEVGANLIHVVYSGPVTILQPRDIPAWVGIVAFTISYFYACHACAMHQIVSLNRMVAVCFPLRYRFIFKKKICFTIIVSVWVFVLLVLSSYNIFPCNQVGYSPTLYEFVFVKCRPNLERDLSIVGTVVNRACFAICLNTMVCDLITLTKIIQIKRSGIHRTHFNRDVRFFAQTSIQNVTMIAALTMIMVVNNGSTDGLLMNVFAFNTLLVTHINNALAMIVFNPEVRARFYRSTSAVRTYSK
ncbi:hypothetical protein L596_019367 [Steinernema carpocapsae]|uniref:G-protein coupled receptors family 1 profile domain-containing protein n=1 Tax=Steinernema carpocapsae TaxID=34508 RepID=A0A4U5MQV0_STECR|nr:hypothetical protein L596_019367 [Steinernema carpocapsae]